VNSSTREILCALADCLPAGSVHVEASGDHERLWLPKPAAADYGLYVDTWGGGGGLRIGAQPIGAPPGVFFWHLPLEYPVEEEHEGAREAAAALRRLILHRSRVLQKVGFLLCSYRCEVDEGGEWRRVGGTISCPRRIFLAPFAFRLARFEHRSGAPHVAIASVHREWPGEPALPAAGSLEPRGVAEPVGPVAEPIEIHPPSAALPRWLKRVLLSVVLGLPGLLAMLIAAVGLWGAATWSGSPVEGVGTAGLRVGMAVLALVFAGFGAYLLALLRRETASPRARSERDAGTLDLEAGSSAAGDVTIRDASGTPDGENEARGDEPATTLAPAMGVPIGFLFVALLMACLGWLALRVLSFAEAGGYVVASWLLAGLCAFAVLRARRSRRARRITITRTQLQLDDRTIERAEIARVRRHRELRFDGVRLDLRDGGWVGILAIQHKASRVLEALRRHGYPVD
jgi:hypothetical protein